MGQELRTAALAFLVVACGSEDAPTVTSRYQPTPLPPLRAAPLTDSTTIVPARQRLDPADARNPSHPDELAAMLAEGYGDFTSGPGLEPTTVVPPGMEPPAAGAGARMLVRFAHLADFQLADDESPARLALFDSPGATAGAFRPQEGHECRIVHALVRSLSRAHQEQALDFGLLGGDNVDNAQENELDWLLAILRGEGSIECDSGADDDPVAGPDNDAKDPFVSDGLALPWYWVTGNHDVLKQGNLVVSAASSAEATGDATAGGTRDWSLPGAPVVGGPVIADAARALLARQALLERVAADGDGHGIGAAQTASGKAYYAFDVQGTALRFVVLDTGCETGGAEGMVRQGDLDSFLRPELDAALDAGKWVVLTAHHAVSSLADGSGFGGSEQPDAVLPDAFREFVGGYPNVLFSVVGHSHRHDVRYIEPALGHAWWEILTSAISDFPHQARIVEIWDQDNGWAMLRATSIDYATDDDGVAHEGRRLGIADLVSGWGEDGRGEAADGNVEVWIPAPP
jgi:hypothetical protein